MLLNSAWILNKGHFRLVPLVLSEAHASVLLSTLLSGNLEQIAAYPRMGEDYAKAAVGKGTSRPVQGTGFREDAPS